MKNYTSSVPVETTVSRIEKFLAKAGAIGVAKSYANGEVTSLCFTLHDLTTGRGMTIRLPAKAAAVEKVLMEQVRKPQRGTLKRIKDQAGRTAWKLMQDWVEVQLSLVEMGQADSLQVFLPYVYDGKRTLYEAFKASGFKMLPEAKEAQ